MKAFDDFVHIAFHNSFYVVEGFAEAVVGDSILQKIVSPYFLRAVLSADLSPPFAV